MRTFSLVVLALVAISFLSEALAQSGIVVQPWRIYEGGVIKLPKKQSVNGDPAAYASMQIPTSNDPKWKPATYGQDGEINFDKVSQVPECNMYIQPTYFQTTVKIPAGTRVDKFAVSYIKADDGARIYIFNSKYRTGTYDEKADLKYGQTNVGAIDLSRFIVAGEDNRVVIAQFDDCPTGNHVRGIDIAVNGVDVTPKVLPNKFKLHAYSINGKRVDKGSDYWLGYDAASNAGKVLGPNSNGTLLQLEKVENSGNGTIALKQSGTNLYLTVLDDKTVKLTPLTAGNKHLFKLRDPEEKTAKNLNFISLESVAFPTWFLRHEHFVLKVTKPTDDQLKNDIVYRQDASWLFESL